jgi:hypothetical protein
MSEQTYRIEELETTGWVQIDNHQGYTKEKTKEVLELLMAEGYNPNLLRAVPERPNA